MLYIKSKFHHSTETLLKTMKYETSKTVIDCKSKTSADTQTQKSQQFKKWEGKFPLRTCFIYMILTQDSKLHNTFLLGGA